MKWVFVALPIGFLVMLLFYYDHVRALLSSNGNITALTQTIEHKQYHCAGEGVPLEGTRWFPLGFLPSRNHHFHQRYPLPSLPERPCPASTRPHRLVDRIRDQGETPFIRRKRSCRTRRNCRIRRRATRISLRDGSGHHRHHDRTSPCRPTSHA